MRDIDNTTGYRFTPLCPSEARDFEWFLPGTEPTEYCPVHSQLFGRVPDARGPVRRVASTRARFPLRPANR
jgi:hypothetical protein